MDVSDECQEIGIGADGLAFESVLEEMSEMFIPVIIIDRVARGDLLDGLRYFFFFFLDEQVDMVGHETIGVYCTTRG